MNIRYTPEWELDGPILLAYPHGNSDWSDVLLQAKEQYRFLIEAFLKGGEEVWLIVANATEASNELSELRCERLRIIENPTDDTWTRDYGPITVERNGMQSLIDFGFNGWGLKFKSCNDNLVNMRLADKDIFNPAEFINRRGFILEGGSIETDGEGTLLTTGRCLLSPNRNPEFTKSEIQDYLKENLGADHFLWLDYGYLAGDDTDSHIDTLARLAPGNSIIFVGCRDLEDEHFEELLHMKAQLMMFRTAQGEPFNLIELPFPDAVYDNEGNRLPATYANYLVTPRCVYMPTYGQPDNDTLACQTIRIAFPEHRVIPVDCRTLILQHGSLHCSTMTLGLKK